mmetsp:Transcript_11229/g.30236  ORF Transcript_11229/g.30236 Transcript_11229/m.30236 type:complete len:245 (+) Transcript_11229:2870-3604(+)
MPCMLRFLVSTRCAGMGDDVAPSCDPAKPATTKRPLQRKHFTAIFASSPPTTSRTTSTPRPCVACIICCEISSRRLWTSLTSKSTSAELSSKLFTNETLRASFARIAAMTRAPRALAMPTASAPVPPDAPVTSTYSPRCSFARSHRATCAVPAAIGNAAALFKTSVCSLDDARRPSAATGTGMRFCSGTSITLAKVPLRGGRNATTASPIAKFGPSSEPSVSMLMFSINPDASAPSTHGSFGFT